jgi:UPF0755 protein
MTLHMKKRGAIILTVSLSAAILAAVAGFFAWRFWYDHRIPNFSAATEVYVYPNMNSEDVLECLGKSGNVLSARSLRRSFRSEGLAESGPKPGHYTVGTSASSVYAARMFRNGWQSPVKLVLSGTIRKRSTIASKISRQMLMDSLTVISALRDSALLSGYGFTPENVMGLFIPDTYQVYWTDSMDVVLSRQKEAWDAFWTPESDARAKAQGLTRMEVATVASIVRAESNHIPEYPRIAGVYLNRLHRGMKLQADPTVAYCYGYTLNRILRKHLAVDSPYNTYLHYGLPPAPINSPGRDAMNAVLNPEGGNYLFFCASPAFDGTHMFSATYSEHRKVARAFQKALNARNAARAQASPKA